MKAFSLAAKNIFKSKLITVISILLVSVAIILLNSTFSSIRGMFSELEFTKGFNDSALYVIQPNTDLNESMYVGLNFEETNAYLEKILSGYCKDMRLSLEQGTPEYYALLNNYDCIIRWAGQHQEELDDGDNYPLYDNFESVVKNSGINCNIERTYSMLYKPAELKGYTGAYFNIFDSEIADRINMNVIKGKDLKDTVSSGNTLEAIAVGSGDFAYDINIGDSFEAEFFNFTTNEYETKTVVISGIIGSPYYLLNGYESFVDENSVSLNTLTTRFSMSDSSEMSGEFSLFIKSFEGFPENVKGYHAGYNPTYYISAPNASAEEISSLKHSLAKAGYNTASVKKAYLNTFEQIKSTVIADSVILIFSILLSLITICGAIVLYISNNIRSHYIYMLCGATLADHVSVCVANISIVCGFSLLLSGGYIFWQIIENTKRMGELFGITYDFYNLLLTLILISLAILMTVVISRKMFRFSLYQKVQKGD